MGSARRDKNRNRQSPSPSVSEVTQSPPLGAKAENKTEKKSPTKPCYGRRTAAADGQRSQRYMKTRIHAILFALLATLCVLAASPEQKIATPMEPLAEKVARSDVAIIGSVTNVHSERIVMTQRMIDVVKKEKEFLVSVLTRIGRSPASELKVGQTYVVVRYNLLVAESLKGKIKPGGRIVVDYAIIDPKFFRKDEYETRFEHLSGSRPDVFILRSPAGGMNYRPIFSGFAKASTGKQVTHRVAKLKKKLKKASANKPDAGDGK